MQTLILPVTNSTAWQKKGRAEYILSCYHCWPMHLTPPVKVITQPVMTGRMRKFCSVRPNQKFHYFRGGWKPVRLLIRLPGHGAEWFRNELPVLSGQSGIKEGESCGINSFTWFRCFSSDWNVISQRKHSLRCFLSRYIGNCRGE